MNDEERKLQFAAARQRAMQLRVDPYVAARRISAEFDVCAFVSRGKLYACVGEYTQALV